MKLADVAKRVFVVGAYGVYANDGFDEAIKMLQSVPKTEQRLWRYRSKCRQAQNGEIRVW